MGVDPYVDPAIEALSGTIGRYINAAGLITLLYDTIITMNEEVSGQLLL